jgi:antirestriction protein
MAVTFQANYKEVLKAETVELIEELLEDNHGLSCILEFINENDEDTFVAYYESYVEQGEKVGYEIVDAFVELNEFCDVENCEDAYVGCYQSPEDFAEEYSNDCGDRIPDHIVVDWEATWSRSLQYDFDAVEKGIGTCFIFRRYY